MVTLLLIIITVILLVLKVTNETNMSWIWVFAPLWIPYGLVFLAILAAAILSYFGIVP